MLRDLGLQLRICDIGQETVSQELRNMCTVNCAVLDVGRILALFFDISEPFIGYPRKQDSVVLLIRAAV